MALWQIDKLLTYGEKTEPGIKIQTVALFMGTKREKLGICFCDAHSQKHVLISPGLANLVNGSTFKTIMKRKVYNALPEAIVSGYPCRMLKRKDKTIIVLFASGAETAFAQSCAVLVKMAEVSEKSGTISLDAMVLSRQKGTVADRIGCLKVSKYHEVVAYEDRGENLSFLKTSQLNTVAKPTDPWGVSLKPLHEQTGSERFHKKIQDARAASQLTPPNPARTKADMGLVSSPKLKPAKIQRDHISNAFIEFKAIIVATIQLNLSTCKGILEDFHRNSEGFLQYKLKEANAAVYNNNTLQVIKGKIKGEYMVAFHATDGFVPLDKEKMASSGQLRFHTLSTDPIVVIAQCTKSMQEHKILKAMEKISGSAELDIIWKSWNIPKFTWINGVPGCGKTSWVIEHFDVDRDVIVTTTTDSAQYLEDRLVKRIGETPKSRVRTLASILVDGFTEYERGKRLLIDKAFNNHFGANVMASRLSEASEVILIGDVNQLTYTNGNLFQMKYSKPGLVTTVSKELLCTHRCPMDVAYALKEIYAGIYTSNFTIRSMEMKLFTRANIPTSQPNTLYLVYTDEEKETLTKQGYGTGVGSRILTIDEAQALRYDSVIIIRSKTKKEPIHDSIPHAVVAVSRHRTKCVYYTDFIDEAIGHFVGKAEGATTKVITEYNQKMAVRNGDSLVVETMMNVRM